MMESVYLGRRVLVEGHQEPMCLPPGGFAVALQKEQLVEFGEAGAAGRCPGGQAEAG